MLSTYIISFAYANLNIKISFDIKQTLFQACKFIKVIDEETILISPFTCVMSNNYVNYIFVEEILLQTLCFYF